MLITHYPPLKLVQMKRHRERKIRFLAKHKKAKKAMLPPTLAGPKVIRVKGVLENLLAHLDLLSLGSKF